MIRAFCSGARAIFFLPFLLHCGPAGEKDGGFVFYPGGSGTSGPVLFSHGAHGPSGAGYACQKCHASASGKDLDITMDGIRQGRGCGACHDGKTAAPRTRKAAAPVQDCASCHMPAADIVIPMNRMDPVAFSHLRHLGADPAVKVTKNAGFACGACHPVPFERASEGPVGMEVPHESGGCAHCHNGQERAGGMPAAFPATKRCLTCHKPAPERKQP